jgi:hypothetical protein
VPLRSAPGVPREVVVWESRVSAHDAGDAAAAWLSAFLGIAVRLVRFDAAQVRRCNPAYAGESGAHTAFADAYPILVLGEASLAELNARLALRRRPAADEPLPAERRLPVSTRTTRTISTRLRQTASCSSSSSRACAARSRRPTRTPRSGVEPLPTRPYRTTQDLAA